MTGKAWCDKCFANLHACICKNRSESVKRPHVHHVIINAWAAGEEIQFWDDEAEDWLDIKNPTWHEDTIYRIKPQPSDVPVDIVRHYWAEADGYICGSRGGEVANLIIVFDGLSKKIKDVKWRNE